MVLYADGAIPVLRLSSSEFAQTGCPEEIGQSVLSPDLRVRSLRTCQIEQQNVTTSSCLPFRPGQRSYPNRSNLIISCNPVNIEMNKRCFLRCLSGVLSR